MGPPSTADTAVAREARDGQRAAYALSRRQCHPAHDGNRRRPATNHLGRSLWQYVSGGILSMRAFDVHIEDKRPTAESKLSVNLCVDCQSALITNAEQTNEHFHLKLAGQIIYENPRRYPPDQFEQPSGEVVRFVILRREPPKPMFPSVRARWRPSGENVAHAKALRRRKANDLGDGLRIHCRAQHSQSRVKVLHHPSLAKPPMKQVLPGLHSNKRYEQNNWIPIGVHE